MNKPIAGDWYKILSQDDGILRFTERHVDPYAVGDFWLVEGEERDLVVDTGSGIVPPIPVIRRVSSKPLLAVALNCYYDHAGAWYSFAERACHPLEAAALQNPARENSSFSTYLKEESLAELPWEGFSLVDYRMIGAEPTVLLRDGDEIALGDRTIEVLHVPGRSSGGLALWETATGSLFTSDMLYDGGHGPAWPPDEPDAYDASLKRFRDLPVRTVYPGHYGPFGAERMRSLIDQQLSQLS